MSQIQIRIGKALFFLCFLATSFGLVQGSNEEVLSSIPVREVTVFKDGHAFVLHEGELATNDQGNIVLDTLPRPVIGTFWPYSAETHTRLSATVTGKEIVTVDKTALSIRELIEANLGKRVLIRDNYESHPYEATLVRLLERTTEELQESSVPGSDPALPQKSDVLLIRVAEGVRAVQVGHIQKITFLDEPCDTIHEEEFRNVMTLKLDWEGKPQNTAQVGMVYLQRGIRWIPNYRIDIDGQGKAHLKLQATLVNELTDLHDTTVHLVIGVPSFAFKDTVDPISLQESVAQLSSVFRENAQTAYAFSNAIMTQAAMPSPRFSETRSRGDTIDLGPEVIGSGGNEDLYVFTLEHVTLKKGQRMVVSVTEYNLEYRDVFVLDLPFGPPPEVRQNFNSQQQQQLAELLAAPKAQHVIRLKNDGEHPITTAPALILREGKLIAQGMTKYTAIGASGDVELTSAVDISVKKLDEETERTPSAMRWNNSDYARSDLHGQITLTNHKDKTITLEVTRSVLGHIDSATQEGTIEHLGRHEGWLTSGVPVWWNWYNWPYWWYHLNSIGRMQWETTLEAGQSIELQYQWHYFWRM
ncbi:MAG: hypothetical protein JXA82_07050 [Sedimentisphaerales bacterium]|nr:hypothetical protein [Sedimentisphaerales bacterium]